MASDEIDQSEIDRTKQIIFQKNAFEWIETETRNVLFLGNTRSGKSTAVSVLKNPCHEPTNFSIFSETVDAKFQSFYVKDNRATMTADEHTDRVVKKYTINVIDTPGLFQIKPIGDKNEARNNESIVKTIFKCLDNEITKLNTVILFASFDTGVDENDVQTITLFAQLFGKHVVLPVTSSSSIASSTSSTSTPKTNEKPKGLTMAICVTRADNHPSSWQASIVDQLRHNPRLEPIFAKYEIQVLFMGCVVPAGGTYFNGSHLLQGYKRVYDMREKLINFIINSQSQQPLVELDIVAVQIDSIKLLINNLKANFKFFMSGVDFSLQGTQDRIITHKAELARLAENDSVCRNNIELLPHFTELLELSKRFETHLNVLLELGPLMLVK